MTVEATFESGGGGGSYTASGSLSDPGSGTISIDGETALANPSKSVVAGVGLSYQAYPSTGWTFESWSASTETAPYGFSEKENPLSIAMTSSHLNIQAIFNHTPFTVTTSTASTSGSTPTPSDSIYGIDPVDPTGYYDCATPISTPAASPANPAATNTNTIPASYVFAGWTDAYGGSVADANSASTMFTLSDVADGSVTANYSARYRVSSVSATGSTITASTNAGTAVGEAQHAAGVLPGTEVTFMAAATSSDPLLSFMAMGPDGYLADSAPSVEVLTFEMPSGNVTVAASTLPPYPGIGEILVRSIYWATTNVAATGTFAPTSYMYDYDLNGRNYQYTWNAVTGGAPGKTAAGYCPSSWRLPTREEYLALVADSSYLWVTVTGPEGKVNGGEFTNKTTGEKLFFPASGRGGGDNLGSTGNYWSSSQYGYNSSYGGHGYFLYISSPNDCSMSYENGYTQTLSVRCVRNAN